MLFLNVEEKLKGLYIYINFLGGLVICGIVFYDIMNYVKVEVIIICVGIVVFMVFFILVGGDIGK